MTVQDDFHELMQRIEEAVSAYKQRKKSIEDIRGVLAKARKTEADCLEQSLTSDDTKLVKRLVESRAEAEIHSRRLTVAEESLPPSLEAAAEAVHQLQHRLVEALSDLGAQRCRACYDRVAQELDLDALDRLFVQRGVRRDFLFEIAAHSPDVLALDRLHPHLGWVPSRHHVPLTPERLESDVELIFAAVREFEAAVGPLPNKSAPHDVEQLEQVQS